MSPGATCPATPAQALCSSKTKNQEKIGNVPMRLTVGRFGLAYGSKPHLILTQRAPPSAEQRSLGDVATAVPRCRFYWSSRLQREAHAVRRQPLFYYYGTPLVGHPAAKINKYIKITDKPGVVIIWHPKSTKMWMGKRLHLLQGLGTLFAVA